ncbi:AT hook motif-containing protein [Striga hermonthica]|uniref:AT hook motif-containing protein n=1 Tax=Striga hermonthica TaxID=68872 RepID=A0A9N7NQR7_STRHE|nr:AT hook motif-containing protein [Striga hermonthica]
MNQGESSTGLFSPPLKRRRGRPPKDPSLKRPSLGHVHSDSDRAIQNLPPRPGPADNPDPAVGQAVTGVVEAALDAGYLLNVRIGNSPATFRGIVFKPGHYVPVTKENDVAPHLQMIKRNDVRVPASTDGPAPLQKRKYTSRRATGPPPPLPTIHPVGERGHVVPVVLKQPMDHNYPNGLPGQVLDFGGDKDVHMVEPLSMLPPDRRQIFVGGQPQGSHPVPPAQVGSKEDEKGLFGEGENARSEGLESSDAEIGGSSDTSDSQYENGKEFMKSPLEEGDSGAVTTHETGNCDERFPNETLQNVSAFSYAPGRMTELLQAVHMKENQVQFAEQPIPGAKIDLRETMNTEVDPKSGSSGP